MSKDTVNVFRHKGEPWIVKSRDSDHAYFLGRLGHTSWEASEHPVGFRVPSPSTISSVAYSDPGALLNWAANLARQGKSHEDERKYAADCGDVAHAQLDRLITTGQPLDPEGQEERTKGALEAIAEWWDAYQPEPVASEVVVASPTHRFAGRFDLKTRLRRCPDDAPLLLRSMVELGGIVIVDLKSTGPGEDWKKFYRYKGKRAFAQLAGYAIADAEMDGNSPIYGRCVLRVGADGTWDFEPDHAPAESEQAFLSKLKTYRDDQAYGRAVTANKKAEHLAAINADDDERGA